MKGKQKLAVGLGVLAALALFAAVAFGPKIRQVVSFAKSATMDEQTAAEKSEENAQLDQDLRNRYQIPDMEVSEDINAALADGSTTLEEAAAQLLEENGGALPELSTREPHEPEIPEPPQETPTQPEQPAQPPAQTEQSAQQETPAPQTTAETPAPQEAPTRQPPVQPEPETPVQAEPAQPAEAEKPAEPEKPQVSEEEQKLQNLVAQMYVLRSSFNSQLDSIVDACIDEFLALPESEQTTVNKIRIVSARLDTVSTMEQTCDEQVASIVGQIQELDPDLAAQVKSQYENEKALKKASLLAQFNGG